MNTILNEAYSHRSLNNVLEWFKKAVIHQQHFFLIKRCVVKK